MKGLENPTYLAAWIFSNIAALLILWAAVRKPKLGRALFVLLFGWASWTNFITAWQTPKVYLEYASMSVKWYSDFILGWFGEHVTLVVTAIAAGQALIAAGMLLRGWWVRGACIGAIVFLLSIAPLGVGAGFPFSVTASVAAWVILKKDTMEYLWKAGHPEQTGVKSPA